MKYKNADVLKNPCLQAPHLSSYIASIVLSILHVPSHFPFQVPPYFPIPVLYSQLSYSRNSRSLLSCCLDSHCKHPERSYYCPFVPIASDCWTEHIPQLRFV